MSLGNVVRRMLLCCVLGAHPVLRIGSSKEEIEDVLYGIHRPRVEVTISEGQKPIVAFIESADQVCPAKAEQPANHT